jgi:hypothetical protein
LNTTSIIFNYLNMWHLVYRIIITSILLSVGLLVFLFLFYSEFKKLTFDSKSFSCQTAVLSFLKFLFFKLYINRFLSASFSTNLHITYQKAHQLFSLSRTAGLAELLNEYNGNINFNIPLSYYFNFHQFCCRWKEPFLLITEC